MGGGGYGLPLLFILIDGMKFDNKFTEKVQEWVQKDSHTDSDALTGAQLLVQIQPRNVSYRRFLSLATTRPASILAKIEYEMKTHLRYRLDGLTLEQVRRLDQKVVPEAKGIIEQGEPTIVERAVGAAKSLGRRADHDKLPAEVQKLWTDNAELYKDIKALFEELKSMEDLPSCQRYDKLQLLAAKDKRYMANMEAYDSYVLDATTQTTAEAAAPAQTEDSTAAIKAVANARAYLSKNLAKFEKLYKDADGSDADSEEAKSYASMLEKMQQRADVLVTNGVMTDEMQSTLSALGLSF